MNPSTEDLAQRADVLQAVRACLDAGERMMLPRGGVAESEIALLRVGEEPNPFGGRVGDYRYQFESEDDLIHLMVVRTDYGPLTPEEGQRVVRFLLPDVQPGLVWLKAGEVSQHFYLGDLG